MIRRLIRRIRWRLRFLKRSFLDLFDPDWWELRRKQRERDGLHGRWREAYIKEHTIPVTAKQLMESPLIYSPYIPLAVLPTYVERSYREQIEELETEMQKMKQELVCWARNS